MGLSEGRSREQQHKQTPISPLMKHQSSSCQRAADLRVSHGTSSLNEKRKKIIVMRNRFPVHVTTLIHVEVRLVMQLEEHLTDRRSSQEHRAAGKGFHVSEAITTGDMKTWIMQRHIELSGPWSQLVLSPVDWLPGPGSSRRPSGPADNKSLFIKSLSRRDYPRPMSQAADEG